MSLLAWLHAHAALIASVMSLVAAVDHALAADPRIAADSTGQLILRILDALLAAWDAYRGQGSPLAAILSTLLVPAPAPATHPPAARVPQKEVHIMATIQYLGTFPAEQVTLPVPTAAGAQIAALQVASANESIQGIVDLANALAPLQSPTAHVTPDEIAAVLTLLGHEIHQPSVLTLAALLPTLAPYVGQKLGPLQILMLISSLYGSIAGALHQPAA